MICTGETMNALQRVGVPASGHLIPSAHSPAQRFLEATLLVQLTTWAGTAAHVPYVLSTHPSDQDLAITFTRPAWAAYLIRGMLPSIAEDTVSGVPGLRVRQHRDHCDVVLLGVGNDVRARVRIRGVKRWKVPGLPDWVDPLGMSRALAPAEVPLVRQQSQSSGEILSAVLRRLPLWRGAESLRLYVVDRTVSLLWLAGPDPHAVAQVLRRSVAAIPDVTVTAALGKERGVAIMTVPQSSVGQDEPWAAWSSLEHVDRTGQATPMPSLDSIENSVSPWADREMRDALAARDITRVYRFLRRRGMAQTDIAHMTGQSRSEVSDIIKGRQVMAYNVLVRIADGLGVPRPFMGLAYDTAVAARVATPTTDKDGNAEAKRRRFLAHAAAVACGSLWSSSITSLNAAPTIAVPTDAELFEVRQIREVVRALRALTRDHGVHACRLPALTELARVRPLLDTFRSQSAQAELRRAINALEQMVAARNHLRGEHTGMAQ